MAFIKEVYRKVMLKFFFPLVRKLNEDVEKLEKQIAFNISQINIANARIEEIQKFKYFKNHIEKKIYYFQQLQIQSKYKDPLSLVPFEYQIHSQNGEDGIIAEIFNRIGARNNFFAEFGASNGEENNTSNLLNLGWKGLWMECDDHSFNYINEKFREKIFDGSLTVLKEAVNAENIEELFEKAKVPEEFDLLSIDIDGNDYWVWKAIQKFSPRVVVMEYNQGKGPSDEYVMPYDPNYMWNMKDGNYGLSLKSVEKLGKEKGYNLVGCGLLGPNAFLVREDLCGDLFQKPYTSEFHFANPNALTYAFEVSPNFKKFKF